MNLINNSLLKSICYTSFTLCLRWLSLMIHARNVWFNPFLLIAPMAGIMLSSTELLVSHLLVASIWAMLVSASFISLIHLPTFCATFVAQAIAKQTTLSKLAIVIFTIAGSVVFLIHPVGNSVWFYPLLWLPILSSIVASSLFIRMWATTLSAHMVGTLLFIYTNTTNSAYWMYLMPIAFVERLCSALVLCVIMHSISYCMRYTKAKQSIGNIKAFISSL